MKTSRRPHILVLRLSALGDVAMTIPVVYSVARRYPDVRFTVATRKFFAQLFINPPANLTVIPLDIKSDFNGVTGTWRLIRKLTALHPTAVADLHNVARTWAIDNWMRLHGVHVAMVDKMRSGRSAVLRRHAVQPSFITRYADVFGRLGYPVDPDFTSIFPVTPTPPIDVDPAALNIGVAPYARYYNKTYPVEMMREVVQRLCRQGARVFLFGGRGREAEELGLWAQEIKGCASVAGKLNLPGELAVMAAMDCMVSMDSANQHLAALTGTKVITVWGSTTPACGFAAYSQPATPGEAISLGLDCQPCSIAGRSTCPRGHLDCLCTLAPEQLARRIHDVAVRKKNSKP